MFQLETERLSFSVFQEADWREFLALSQDPEVMRHISGGDTWSEDKTRKWLARQERNQQAYGYSRYKTSLKATGELVGFCGLGNFGNTGEVEIGWWVKQSLWGKGLATEAARAVKDHALGPLGLDHLISVCTPANTGSSRIMAKVGLRFREETTVEALGLPLDDLVVFVYTSEG